MERLSSVSGRDGNHQNCPITHKTKHLPLIGESDQPVINLTVIETDSRTPNVTSHQTTLFFLTKMFRNSPPTVSGDSGCIEPANNIIVMHHHPCGDQHVNFSTYMYIQVDVEVYVLLDGKCSLKKISCNRN